MHFPPNPSASFLPRHMCARNNKQINKQTDQKKARDEGRARRNDVAVNRRVAEGQGI